VTLLCAASKGRVLVRRYDKEIHPGRTRSRWACDVEINLK